MQYILTEEEYKELKAQQKDFNLAKTKKLQKLCTKICDTMPVQVSWRKEDPPEPWGCILTRREEDEYDNEWFCDECPVQEICPSREKNYTN